MLLDYVTYYWELLFVLFITCGYRLFSIILIKFYIFLYYLKLIEQYFSFLFFLILYSNNIDNKLRKKNNIIHIIYIIKNKILLINIIYI